jgi:hypothetical protein
VSLRTATSIFVITNEYLNILKIKSAQLVSEVTTTVHGESFHQHGKVDAVVRKKLMRIIGTHCTIKLEKELKNMDN